MISRRSALLLPTLWLARCGSSPPPPPSLNLTITGGADQNPDPAGQPAPVAIRLYQLTSDTAFARADVFALTDHQAATLGADDLGSEEIVIAPGEQRSIAHPLQPGARVLGIAALFRDIDRAVWRTQAPLAEHGPTRLVLTTANLRITLT
jgi:type VI secretion system protein VasD